MRVWIPVLLLTGLAAMLAGPAQAQIIDPGDSRAVSFDADNCRGGTSMISYFDFRDVSPDGSVFSFGLDIDGTTRRFTLDSNAFDPDDLDNPDITTPDEFLDQIPDAAWRSYVEFFLRELGCFGGFGGFGSVVVTADPVVNQSIQTFQTIAFSERAAPRAAAPRSPQGQQRAADAVGDDEDEGGSVRLREVSSDVEYEFFELNQLSGDNLAIRGGYAQTSGNGRWMFGLNGIYNRLAFDGADATYHGSGSLFISRVSNVSLGGETVFGISGSYLFFENGDPGFGVAVHSVRRWYPGGGGALITFGTMAQFTQIGDLQNTYLNVAALVGFPLGRRLALNIDGLLLWNADQRLDGDTVELDDPYVLNPGAFLTFLLGDAFALNLGARTVLLVEDYTSTELTLGAGVRF